MTKIFYRNVRLLILTIILICVWGLSSFQVLPRQEDPELVKRAAVVTTLFPGASAERVEALVTEVIESELSEIEEIKTIESDSRVGLSAVTLELQDAIKNADPIWSKVRDELDDARRLFPQGVLEPELDEAEVNAYALIAALVWERDEPPNYAIIRRYAEELKVAMNGVPGTEQVDLFGDPEEEIVVEVNQSDLAAIGLNVQQLSEQISNSDAKVTAGQLRSRRTNLPIEVESELDSTERIRQIPVQSNNTSGAQFTRLGDLARVSRGIIQPPTDLAFVGGKPAISVGVLMESGNRIDQWAQVVRQDLEKFRKTLPSGLKLQVIFDQSSYVENRLDGLISNLLVSAALVVGVTMVCMGWRSSLIVGSALPLTVFAVFGWMRVVGIPLHQMSVTGLILALGLLIDNAIVMVDEVGIKLRKGLKPEAAVVKSVGYLAAPLLASTATTIFSFMPIALLPGGAGEFVGSIAVSVILALISSLAISLTIIPVLVGKVQEYRLRRERRKPKKSSFSIPLPAYVRNCLDSGISYPPVERVYAWTVKKVVARPIIGLVLSLTIPVIGFLQAGTLEEQFFPSVLRDQFQIELEMPAMTAIAETSKQVLSAREQILSHPEVADVHWFIGESAPKFYYNFTGGLENAPYYAQALVQLKSSQGARQLIWKLQDELNEKFPQARVLVRQLEQGPPFEAPVEMRIYGPDIQRLRQLGIQARAILAQVADVTQVRDDLTEPLPKLGLRLDEEQARLAGLNNTAIARQLDAQLEGSVGGSILEATEELPVRVRIADKKRGDLNQIASLDLQASQSSQSQSSQSQSFRPLSALGNFDLVPELAKISRRDEQRVNTIQGFIKAGVLPAKVLTDFQQQLENSDFQLPPGYRYEFGGETEERDQAVGGLLATLGLLVVAMIAALVLSLGSFRQAAIVGVIAICSIGLAMFALWLFNSVLGFMAIVGSMGLVGIAINDSIVVLAALNDNPAARQGDRKAASEVVIEATRHVMTTTVTTIIGFTPLLIDGDPFWLPLAIAIAGGLSGASLLALYFVPSAYLLLKPKSRRTISNKNNTKTPSIIT